jgi:Kef-type K+ transport system membrane component KefB
MAAVSRTFVILGVIFLLGLLTDFIGRRTKLPRVTLLLVFGYVIGPGGAGLLSPHDGQWFSLITNMALVMVGFLLGETLTLAAVRAHGNYVLWFSVGEVIATALVVLGGLIMLGIPAHVALLLAGIATATDPVATTDVVHEAGANGVFTRTLLGIVAVDDAWGLIVFSLLFTVSEVVAGHGGIGPLITGLWEVVGAVGIGVVLGIPMAYLTGRVRPGEPTLVEALGVVFLCGGIAMWLDVSFLLASMVLGCVVANVATHHSRPFHAIEGIESPFTILFFVIAGASLQVHALTQVGILGAGYVVFRVIGRLAGGWGGRVVSRANPAMGRWMGVALLPQAGVALGMALVAVQNRPQLEDVILPVVIASTALFEVFGPLCARMALVRTGEVKGEQT